MHLFQDRKLQPSTIDGYRSGIAGKLGNSLINNVLALGSGKCRSEIPSWQNKNITHQSDWSKVFLYPSPSFLSKNQLAKVGPDSVGPVVIPAPTLEVPMPEHYATIWTGPQTSGRTRS